MVDMESSEEFENNPIVILLLFTLFNKNVYFIQKYEIGLMYNHAIALREVLVNNLQMGFTIKGITKIIVHQNIHIGEDMNMELRCKTH